MREFVCGGLDGPVEPVVLDDGAQAVCADPVDLRESRDLAMPAVLVITSKQDVTTTVQEFLFL